MPARAPALTGMKKNNYPGKFIVIEGLDGSGKSVQAELLVNFLKQQSKEVIRTKEQTADSKAGLKIKEILLGKAAGTPLELQKLFVQDRKEHLENQIIPALQTGKHVVCERYAASTVAFGGSAGLDIDLLVKMNDNFLLPDLTIILDVSPEICMQRIDARGEPKELFEKAEKLAKVREIYKKMPQIYGNVSVVNGENSEEKVFEDVKKLVNKII